MTMQSVGIVTWLSLKNGSDQTYFNHQTTYWYTQWTYKPQIDYYFRFRTFINNEIRLKLAKNSELFQDSFSKQISV